MTSEIWPQRELRKRGRENANRNEASAYADGPAFRTRAIAPSREVESKLPMRKVVDSNFLQADALRGYLSRSSAHHVVLTDYASMEAYKGDTLASIYRSMEIISRYPRQVVVLKGTQIVCGLSGRRAGLQRRLIDEEQTLGFARYCRHLHLARAGDHALQEQLLNLGREASAHMDRLLDDASQMGQHFDEIARLYSESEIRALRTGSGYSRELIDKHVRNIMHVAGYMFRDHPTVLRRPSFEELSGTYIFRAALCVYLLALEWISVGGAMSVKPERIRNDMVDVSFAAYATYFDGLLTVDRKLDRIYRTARELLNVLFDVGRQ